jgi:hypothetical protein
LLQFTSFNLATENNLLTDNATGAYQSYAASKVHKFPQIGGYVLYQPSVGHGEYWLHYTADTTTKLNTFNVLNFYGANYATLQGKLTWDVINENNNHHFDLKRASGNEALQNSLFDQVARISSLGNGSFNKYTHIDTVPQNNQVYYYQLQWTDNIGRISQSEIIPIVFGDSLPWIVYPNPFVNNFNVQLQMPRGQEVSVTAYNIMGKRLLQRYLTPTAYIDKFVINANWPPGVYTIVLASNGKSQTFRVLSQ